MGKNVEISAKGVRGFIMYDEGGPFFRVYKADHEFTDYDLVHGDLEVEIVDESASLYSGTGNGSVDKLDYSSQVLGNK